MGEKVHKVDFVMRPHSLGGWVLICSSNGERSRTSPDWRHVTCKRCLQKRPARSRKGA
jgi:hypothetical protein